MHVIVPVPIDEHSELTRLVDLANSLGLMPEDLDDLVYDLVGIVRAASYNSGEDDPEMDLVATDDEESDLEEWTSAFDERASNINNEGIEGQVSYLVSHLGAKNAETELRTIVPGSGA